VKYDNLLYETTAGVATVTINRPQVLNSLNQATIAELTSALKEAGDDPGVRAVIITGAGETQALAESAKVAEVKPTDPSPGGG
jgi:enoyl-CoA hydratase/carnithine racemase